MTQFLFSLLHVYFTDDILTLHYPIYYHYLFTFFKKIDAINWGRSYVGRFLGLSENAAV